MRKAKRERGVYRRVSGALLVGGLIAFSVFVLSFSTDSLAFKLASGLSSLTCLLSAFGVWLHGTI